jgi:SAM-dependent methyltransferase
MAEEPSMDDRRMSFGAWAADYAAHRPSYPSELVDLLTARGPGVQIVDLGAGTGLLSVDLLAAGADVTAVEPDERMREVLATAVGPTRAVSGTAEELPLPDASVDVVVAAQMWHWVDPARAIPEVARVLRPGGMLAVVWNLRDDNEAWVAEHSAAVGLPDGARGFDDSSVPPLGPPFGPYRIHTLRHRQPMTLDGLLGLLATHSVIVLRDDWAATEAATRKTLADHPELDPAGFELPYVCKVFAAYKQ